MKEKAADKAPEVKAKLEKASEVAANAATDTRITAAIKTKLAVEPDLSALQISVNTTDGTVTLAGRVKTTDLAERAVTLAKSVDGVRDVKSTLQAESERR